MDNRPTLDPAAELRTLIAESVERALADGVTPAIRAAAEAGQWPDALWTLAQDLGLDRVLLPEEEGNTGPPAWRHAEPVIRAWGEHAAPLPLPEVMVARWLLARAGIPQPDGVLTLAPASLAGTAGVPVGPGAALARVPWGRRADWVVATVGAAPTGVLLIPAKALAWHGGTNLAGEPRDRGLVAGATPLVPVPVSGLATDTVLYLGALLRSTQIAGAATALVRATVDFAGNREQFGRPLARFQVIQHNVVRLAEAAAMANAVTAAAWQSLAGFGLPVPGPGRRRRGGGQEPLPSKAGARLLIAAAKATTGSLVDTLAGLAHQVHGAMGFTAEFPLHHLTRRLWAWRAEFGTPAQWHDGLGELAIRRGGDGVWADLTSATDG